MTSAVLTTVSPPVAGQDQALRKLFSGMAREDVLLFVGRLFDADVAGLSVWDDAELVTRFLASCSRTGSAETEAAYRADLALFAAWRDRHYPGLAIRAMAPGHCDEYVGCVRALVAAGSIRAATHNRRVSTISALFRWASEPNRAPSSGIPRSPMPRRCLLATSKTEKALSDQELTGILGTIQAAAMAGDPVAHRDYVLVRSSYLLGTRVSELRCLRWGDVERLPDGGGLITIVKGKGSKPRVVRVSDDTVSLFESLGRGPADAWIFPGRGDGPMTRQGVGNRFRRWGAAAGLRLHPHRCRHSHATNAIRSGCDVFTLQATLGHSSSATTAHYVASNPNDSSSLRLG